MMTPGEINRLVNNYIGVDSGYLGDFSYRTHQEFYASLDLDIDPNTRMGTTRERFIAIVKESSPEIQARILRGILDRYPVGSSELRTQDRYDQFISVALRLEGIPCISSPALKITSDVVERSIADAEALLNATGATSGVDRIHTSMHGYLRAVCRASAIPFDEQATITQLYRLLREQHPVFLDLGTRGTDINTLLRTFSSALDALNPLRNRASVAHPNDELLELPEAMLVINVARTLLHYFDTRISASNMVES